MRIDTMFTQKNMPGVVVPFDPNLDFLIGIQHEWGNVTYSINFCYCCGLTMDLWRWRLKSEDRMGIGTEDNIGGKNIKMDSILYPTPLMSLVAATMSLSRVKMKKWKT